MILSFCFGNIAKIAINMYFWNCRHPKKHLICNLVKSNFDLIASFFSHSFVAIKSMQNTDVSGHVTY